MYWVFFLFVTPFCLSALITNFLYWYETLNTPCPAFPLQKAGVFSCLSMYLRTLFGYFACFFAHPLGWAMRPLTSKHLPKIKQATPLLLLHGIYHNASCWTYLRLPLERAGFYCTTFSYHSFFVEKDTIIQRLDAAVASLTQQTGEKPILIGHSLGGIFIRLWLQQGINKERIKGVVTLGTPHAGSKLARIAPGRLVRCLVPTNPMMQKLQQETFEDQLPCISLCSPADEAVLPASSLVPPAGWKMRLLPGPSHIGMLCRRDTGRILLEEIYRLLDKEKRTL